MSATFWIPICYFAIGAVLASDDLVEYDTSPRDFATTTIGWLPLLAVAIWQHYRRRT